VRISRRTRLPLTTIPWWRGADATIAVGFELVADRAHAATISASSAGVAGTS
jgi:hypothetical protein